MRTLEATVFIQQQLHVDAGYPVEVFLGFHGTIRHRATPYHPRGNQDLSPQWDLSKWYYDRPHSSFRFVCTVSAEADRLCKLTNALLTLGVQENTSASRISKRGGIGSA